MAVFNVVQRRRRAAIADNKRDKHGDPVTRKLKQRPQIIPISGKRKRKLFKKWRRDQKDAIANGLITMEEVEMAVGGNCWWQLEVSIAALKEELIQCRRRNVELILMYVKSVLNGQQQLCFFLAAIFFHEDEEFKISWKRVAITSLFGFGFVGPVGHFWSGIQQRRNSFVDGVYGTTCPIPPGKNYTYILQVKDQIGSFYYFPSLAFHKAAGDFGGIRILSRPRIPVPFDEPAGDYTVLIGDWYKSNHTEIEA